MVSHVPVPTVVDHDVDALPLSGGSEAVRAAMAKLCAPASVVSAPEDASSLIGPPLR